MARSSTKKTHARPADGGSYRHTSDGYQRLDKPQQADPGKTARRAAVRATPTPAEERAENNAEAGPDTAPASQSRAKRKASADNSADKKE